VTDPWGEYEVIAVPAEGTSHRAAFTAFLRASIFTPWRAWINRVFRARNGVKIEALTETSAPWAYAVDWPPGLGPARHDLPHFRLFRHDPARRAEVIAQAYRRLTIGNLRYLLRVLSPHVHGVPPGWAVVSASGLRWALKARALCSAATPVEAIAWAERDDAAQVALPGDDVLRHRVTERFARAACAGAPPADSSSAGGLRDANVLAALSRLAPGSDTLRGREAALLLLARESPLTRLVYLDALGDAPPWDRLQPFLVLGPTAAVWHEFWIAQLARTLAGAALAPLACHNHHRRLIALRDVLVPAGHLAETRALHYRWLLILLDRAARHAPRAASTDSATDAAGRSLPAWDPTRAGLWLTERLVGVPPAAARGSEWTDAVRRAWEDLLDPPPIAVAPGADPPACDVVTVAQSSGLSPRAVQKLRGRFHEPPTPDPRTRPGGNRDGPPPAALFSRWAADALPGGGGG
jgi:hypothetical protein